MTDLNELIEESRTIRDEFLKTIGRLEAFSQALSAEAERLREGIENAGNSQAGNEPSNAASTDAQRKREASDEGGSR